MNAWFNAFKKSIRLFFCPCSLFQKSLLQHQGVACGRAVHSYAHKALRPRPVSAAIPNAGFLNQNLRISRIYRIKELME